MLRSNTLLPIITTVFILITVTACDKREASSNDGYNQTKEKPSEVTISRALYRDKLYGFWLGQCIGNWTGLVTEMDKVGNIGEVKTGAFYITKDWGQPDLPNIWSDSASNLSTTIDFVLRSKNEVWGADDDTDIEYMYQHLLYTHKTSLLSPEQIKDGWLKHIKKEEENYLWVSNQQAYDLMSEGMLPPATGHKENNPQYDMIDAQLTTEIFGLFAPTRPDFALKMAHLPIRTTARDDAEWISEFYVIMHALAPAVDQSLSMKKKTLWLAANARKRLPHNSYSGKMYDFVLNKYNEGLTWEAVRDSVYERYQVQQKDGYDITSRNMYCNGCFAAGINFAASLVSLFYGEGDIRKTIKIGTLSGWDSDNPTATWAGLLGFMLGKKGVEAAFGSDLSDKFNIHRTRQNFPKGIDTFDDMAEKGIFIVDRVVQESLGGSVDLTDDVWHIPSIPINIEPGQSD